MVEDDTPPAQQVGSALVKRLGEISERHAGGAS
jgi:hypothetical protein